MLHTRIYGDFSTGREIGRLYDTGAFPGSSGLIYCPGPLMQAIRAVDPFPCCLSISSQLIAQAHVTAHNDNGGDDDRVA